MLYYTALVPTTPYILVMIYTYLMKKAKNVDIYRFIKIKRERD